MRERGQRGFSRRRGSLASTLGMTSAGGWDAADIQNHSLAVILILPSASLLLPGTQVPANQAGSGGGS